MMDPIAGILVELGERVTTVRELIKGWEAHVLRLDEEHSHRLSELTSAWGVYDYHAALLIRNHVEMALSSAPPEHRGVAAAEVDAIDARFRRFTEYDASREMERFLSSVLDESRGVEGWWWRRIPVSGPVREELAAVMSGHRSERDGAADSPA